VLHQLLVIGEAVYRLSDALTAQHPTMPWASIRGMRNHVIHGYDSVDLDAVWQAVVRDVPALLNYVEPLITRVE